MYFHACAVEYWDCAKQNIQWAFHVTCYYTQGPSDPRSDSDSQSRFLPEGVHPGVFKPVHIGAQQLQIVLEVQLRQRRAHLHPCETAAC